MSLNTCADASTKFFSHTSYTLIMFPCTLYLNENVPYTAVARGPSG